MMRLRPVVQLAALAVMLALPMLSRGGALHEAFGAGAQHLDALATPWERFLILAFSTTFGWLDDAIGAAALFQGSYWSITLFGVTFNDPLAALGHAVAGGSIHWPLIAGALISVGLAVVAGRAFCGWICPVNTILELNDRLRRWLERRIVRMRLPQWLPTPNARWLVLAAGLVISAVAGFNVFAFILPYVGLARDWHQAVYGAGVGVGVFFVMVLIAVELLAAPRLWCRSLCPTGLILGWLGKAKVVDITRKPEGECLTGCSLCLTTCRFGVAPRDQLDTDKCMLCNACVTSCPADVLAIGPVRPTRKKWPRRAVATIAVAVLGVVLSQTAFAHHVKGMPHYGYLENYPQTPTYEKHIAAPPYEIVVVVYRLEGLDRDRSDTPDDAMIYLSLTEASSRKAYRGRLRVTLRPVGGGAAISRSFKAPLEEKVYRMRAALPADEYELTVRVQGAPDIVAVARLSFGGGINGWLIAIGAIGVMALGGIGAAVAVRRRRMATHRHEVAG